MNTGLNLVAAAAFGWCILAGVANGAARPVPAARMAGNAQVRLADWAAAQGISLRWVRRDEVVQLSKGSTQIQLTVDSRQARVNGVEVWLSFPPSLRGGVTWLARLDIDTTLQPLLAGLKELGPARVRTICVDPGHGGKDPGNCVGSSQEKKYALLLAQEVGQCLTRDGFKVVFTRTGDKFIDLEMRPDIAQRRKADLFVSLHFNSAETGRSEVQGAQVFCLTPAGASSTNTRGEAGSVGWCPGNRTNDRSLWLAYEIQRALVRTLGAEDRGLRRARFAVLRESLIPAVLVEAGFMSHPVEGRKIFSAGYRHQLAEAIAQGVRAYAQAADPAGSRDR